jgi:hypothetical protein
MSFQQADSENSSINNINTNSINIIKLGCLYQNNNQNEPLFYLYFKENIVP